MKRYFLLLLSLFIYIGMRAGTVEVKTNLWTGTQEMDAKWSNWLTIASSSFQDAEEEMCSRCMFRKPLPLRRR